MNRHYNMPDITANITIVLLIMGIIISIIKVNFSSVPEDEVSTTATTEQVADAVEQILVDQLSNLDK